MSLDLSSSTTSPAEAEATEFRLSPNGMWTTVECAALTRVYPGSGAKGAREVLPHRTLGAIHAKARALGLKAPIGTTCGMTFARKYERSEAIDNQIREGYMHLSKKGDVKRLAERVGRPAWYVQKRASSMGLCNTTRTRVDAWSKEELAIVERWAMCEVRLIAKKLTQAGYYRTPNAVGLQIKRRGIDTSDPNAMLTADVAAMLGINPKTVTDWIDRRGLKAEKRAYGHTGKFVIQRKHLRSWIAANPRFIDLRRVDQVWFMDLIFGGDL